MTINSVTRPKGARKFLIQAAIGAVAGAAAMFGLMAALDALFPVKPSGDRVIAAGVGMVYLLMAAFVALGTLSPGLGARLLHVADAEEIRDDRAVLGWAAAGCALIGVILVTLALGGTGGARPASGAVMAILGVSALALVVTWRRSSRGQDEFRKLVGAEASQAALALTLLLFGGWAALAETGHAAPFTPLAFVGGLAGLILVAAFWTVWRRGMMADPAATR